MLFAGQYGAKLERRGKVQLPKNFIHALSKQHFKGVYIFPSLDGKYLEGCGEAWLAYWSRKMDERDSLLGKEEILLSNVMDMMVPLEFDKSSRIILPIELINHASLTSPLMIVGRGFRFQIRNKDDFFKHRNHMRAQFNIMNKLDEVEEASKGSENILELKLDEEKTQKEVKLQKKEKEIEAQKKNKKAKSSSNKTSPAKTSPAKASSSQASSKTAKQKDEVS